MIPPSGHLANTAADRDIPHAGIGAGVELLATSRAARRGVGM